ncbi:MAG: hypothetical protein JWL70_789 [Acidimicrobiia bacterium]|nr:hypothetical protein [Acidimicrobiia bacterium]
MTAPTATRTVLTATRTALTPDSGVPEADPSMSLARCVGDIEGFLADRYTRSPHWWQGSGFDDLLSLRDVDGQLTGAGLRRPSVRVVRNGEPIDPSLWAREVRTGSARVSDLVHPGRLMELFGDGATIVLQSLQRWWPPLSRFCRQLELTLGHAVQANAYLTPAGAAGLSPHHDTHDVFVMQVFGQKHWTVREPLIEAPLPRHHSNHEAAAQQPVLFERVLEPGQCLYLPRGYIHSAATQTGASLHLTIGVLATTAHEVLRRLVDRAAEEVTFRQALPPQTSQDVARATAKSVVADLTAWLERFDLDELADEEITALTAVRTHQMPLLDGQLLELVGLQQIDDQTMITARGPRRPDMRRNRGRIEIEAGDHRLELPEGLWPALERLLDGAAHRVAELGDLLDGPSRLVLVRRLVREGVLRTDGS